MVQPIEIKGETLGYIESRRGGRQENQDFADVRDTPLGYLIVVCDGMGGMQGGRVASELAVYTIINAILAEDKQTDRGMALVKAIRKANMAVIEEGQRNPELRGMGTTVTALLLTPYSAVTAYVGDSRIYQLRKGKKIFRTFDHSMVFEMVKKKVISEEQARLSAQSNVIMRALGIHLDVEVDIQELPYQKGDRFILCSDGFWGAMPEEQFIRYLVQKIPVNQVLESTANAVESLGRSSGMEYDNLTAAIIEMKSNSILKEKMNRLAKCIISILAILLLVSIALNTCLFLGKIPTLKSDQPSVTEAVSDSEVIQSENASTVSEPEEKTPMDDQHKAQ